MLLSLQFVPTTEIFVDGQATEILATHLAEFQAVAIIKVLPIVKTKNCKI
jgi:hypothetical protein